VSEVQREKSLDSQMLKVKNLSLPISLFPIRRFETDQGVGQCAVVGLNNNAFQVGRANKYTEKAGLADQVSFVKGDFMKLSEQFGPNSFDAV